MTDTRERIVRLETTVAEIKDNHLVHLQSAVDKVSDKLDRLDWLLITTLVGVLVTIVLRLAK